MSKHYVGPKSQTVRDELKSLDSSLAELSYQKEYKVPEGYFESNKNELLASLHLENSRSIGRIRQLWQPIMGVAAAVVLGIFVFQSTSSVEEGNLSIEDLELATLENYLLDQTEYLGSDVAVDYDLIDLKD